MKQIQEQCVRDHPFSTSQQRAAQLPTQQGRKAPRTPGKSDSVVHQIITVIALDIHFSKPV